MDKSKNKRPTSLEVCVDGKTYNMTGISAEGIPILTLAKKKRNTPQVIVDNVRDLSSSTPLSQYRNDLINEPEAVSSLCGTLKKAKPGQKRKSRMIPIGVKKHISITQIGGEQQITIRDCTKDSHGSYYSTKRGIRFTPSEWKRLKSSHSVIDKLLEGRQ